MAIIKCKECSTEVSDKAKQCPKCGVSDPGNKDAKEKAAGCLGVLALAIVGALFFGFGGNTEQFDKLDSLKSQLKRDQVQTNQVIETGLPIFLERFQYYIVDAPKLTSKQVNKDWSEKQSKLDDKMTFDIQHDIKNVCNEAKDIDHVDAKAFYVCGHISDDLSSIIVSMRKFYVNKAFLSQESLTPKKKREYEQNLKDELASMTTVRNNLLERYVTQFHDNPMKLNKMFEGVLQ